MKFIVSSTSRMRIVEECKSQDGFFTHELRGVEKLWVDVIEFNELHELIDFQKKYDMIIIKNSGYLEIPLEIEIYDDFRC